MNGYVAGGWGATAGMLALYTWRMLSRGRTLTRSLPDETAPSPDLEELKASDAERELGGLAVDSRVDSGLEGGQPAPASPGEVRAWP